MASSEGVTVAEVEVEARCAMSPVLTAWAEREEEAIFRPKKLVNERERKERTSKE